MGHRYLTGFPVLWAGLLLGIPDQAVAQGGILSELEGLDKGNAQPYVEPLARGLILAMEGGLFDTATPLKALGFDLGARVSGALHPSQATTFEAVLPESITWGDPQFGGTFEDPLRPAGGDRETPTLVGEGAWDRSRAGRGVSQCNPQPRRRTRQTSRLPSLEGTRFQRSPTPCSMHPSEWVSAPR